MSALGSFFHGSRTELGVFYPRHYLLAVFEGFQEAQDARLRLIDLGTSPDEVIAVPGEDVVQFAREHWRHDGLWGVLMREVSRRIGTEAQYADHDLEEAQQGAGFVAVHCRNER